MPTKGEAKLPLISTGPGFLLTGGRKSEAGVAASLILSSSPEAHGGIQPEGGALRTPGTEPTIPCEWPSRSLDFLLCDGAALSTSNKASGIY